MNLDIVRKARHSVSSGRGGTCSGKASRTHLEYVHCEEDMCWKVGPALLKLQRMMPFRENDLAGKPPVDFNEKESLLEIGLA